MTIVLYRSNCCKPLWENKGIGYERELYIAHKSIENYVMSIHVYTNVATSMVASDDQLGKLGHFGVEMN